MAFGLDGNRATTFNPSRWNLLEDALTPALLSLEKNVQLGAKFFPETTASSLGPSALACTLSTTLDVAPALNTRSNILDIFRRTNPRGGTPTAAAVAAGAAALEASGSRAVTKFMVLATDGAPNCGGLKDAKTCVCASPDPTDCATSRRLDAAFQCMDDDATVSAIQKAATAAKIPTFVIGIGQSQRPEFASALDRMAVAGGRPRASFPHYYEVLETRDLTQAFSQIEASITQCTFVTPSRPKDVASIQIEVAGVAVPYDSTRTNGWDYLDPVFGEIALFGEACSRARLASVDGGVPGTDGGTDSGDVPTEAGADAGGSGEGFVKAIVTCSAE